MCCDKCGKSLGIFKAIQKDGTIWCDICVKDYRKNPPWRKPKDQFFMLCRKLGDIRIGHVLLGGANSIIILNDFGDLSNVSYSVKGVTVYIPDEFYKCLKVFKSKKIDEGSYVFIRKAGLRVKTFGEPTEMTLDYGGADTSKVGFNITLDAAYLMALKPKSIRMGKLLGDACLYEKCAAKGAEDLKHVYVIPMEVEDE